MVKRYTSDRIGAYDLEVENYDTPVSSITLEMLFNIPSFYKTIFNRPEFSHLPITSPSGFSNSSSRSRQQPSRQEQWQKESSLRHT